MLKPIIRLLAFFSKELAELRRQPRLLLSLVLGPFLILLIFGLGFSGERPTLRTLLVVSPGMADDPLVRQFMELINRANFEVIDVETDEQAAINRLINNPDRIDVVEVLPSGIDDLDQFLNRQEQAPIKVLYNEIDPMQEQWIQYLSYVQAKELNIAVLLATIRTTRGGVGNLTDFISETRQDLQTIQTGLAAAQDLQIRAALQRLRSNSRLLLAALALSSESEATQRAQEEILELQRSLVALERTVEQGEIEEQQQRIRSIDEKLGEIEQLLSQIQAVPPEVLVSPLQPLPQNLAQQQLTFIAFYAPGVLALLLQHLAITMAALALVREQLLGSTELFRVAPVGSMQIILGKYIGFILFTAIVISLLVGLLVADIPIGNTGYSFGLAVPFRGDWLWFGIAVLLVTIASLSVGFLISALSKTDSQAVQLSMIILLASIFFSGFFMPLRNFAAFVRWLALLLPVTHGVQAFQTIMLRGTLPARSSLIWLGGITLVCFMLAWSIWRSNLKRR
jgi:ABC-2 type transport system permease protein